MSDNSREWKKIIPARTHTFHTKLSDGSIHVEIVSMPPLKLNAHVRTLPVSSGAGLVNEKVYLTPAGIAKVARGVNLAHDGSKDAK